MYNHNKAQQSENRVRIFWDILYITGRKTEMYDCIIDYSDIIYKRQLIIHALLQLCLTWTIVDVRAWMSNHGVMWTQ